MIYYNVRKNNNVFFFAHRGAPQLISENTIESVNKAISLGCDGIEVDLQKTKDNKIILFPGRLTEWKGQIEFLKILE